MAQFPNNLDIYHIVGTSNLGLQNLKAAAIFDYDIGDNLLLSTTESPQKQVLHQ